MTPRPPSDHIRRFMAAIREERLDLGGIAAKAGLTLTQVFEVWAYGKQEKKLRFRDDGPGFRWIEEGGEE